MPMDVAALAPAAIALLGPYLAKGGEEFAKATGKVAAEKVGPLYQAIKAKFKKDAGNDAKQALARVEDAPDSPSRLNALEKALTELMARDADFAETVRELVQASQAEGSGGRMTAVGSYIAQADRGSTATVSVNRPEE